jgi:hypothetical protein
VYPIGDLGDGILGIIGTDITTGMDLTLGIIHIIIGTVSILGIILIIIGTVSTLGIILIIIGMVVVTIISSIITI